MPAIALPLDRVSFLIDDMAADENARKAVAFVPCGENQMEVVPVQLVEGGSFCRGSVNYAERRYVGFKSSGYSEIEVGCICNLPLDVRKHMGFVVGYFHKDKTVREVMEIYKMVDSAKQPDLNFEDGIGEGIKAAVIYEREEFDAVIQGDA